MFFTLNIDALYKSCLVVLHDFFVYFSTFWLSIMAGDKGKDSDDIGSGKEYQDISMEIKVPVHNKETFYHMYDEKW